MSLSQELLLYASLIEHCKLSISFNDLFLNLTIIFQQPGPTTLLLDRIIIHIFQFMLNAKYEYFVIH